MDLLSKIEAKAGIIVSDMEREIVPILIDAIIPQPKLTTFLNDANEVVDQHESTKSIEKSSVVYRLNINDKPSAKCSDIIATNGIINPLRCYGGIHAMAHFAEFVYTKPNEKLGIKIGDTGAALRRVEISFENREARLNAIVASGGSFNV